MRVSKFKNEALNNNKSKLKMRKNNEMEWNGKTLPKGY